MRINPFQNPGIHVKTGYFPIYFSFHKAQNLLAICGQDRVDFWNANAKPIYSFHCVETPGQISFSPSGKYLAILHGEYVSVLNTNEFRLEKKINGRKAISISFFKEDAIFLGTEFGEIFEINLEGNILSEKKFEELPILNLTYSTRHSILFARTNGNSVQLWNLNSTEKAPYLLENHSEVLSIFYSNKTSTIFCGTESGEIHIWK
ncbi:MAG: hypothetical protein KDK36_01195, partial [Leptospiraceae bacterium]|nr:hypothetical protein [Leptospiraceae bacterium]